MSHSRYTPGWSARYMLITNTENTVISTPTIENTRGKTSAAYDEAWSYSARSI